MRAQRTKDILIGKTLQELDNPQDIGPQHKSEAMTAASHENSTSIFKEMFVDIYEEEMNRCREIYNKDTKEVRRAKPFEFNFNTNYYVLNVEIDETGNHIETKTSKL